jgi:hypothetical protein
VLGWAAGLFEGGVSSQRWELGRMEAVVVRACWCLCISGASRAW